MSLEALNAYYQRYALAHFYRFFVFGHKNVFSTWARSEVIKQIHFNAHQTTSKPKIIKKKQSKTGFLPIHSIFANLSRFFSPPKNQIFCFRSWKHSKIYSKVFPFVYFVLEF